MLPVSTTESTVASVGEYEILCTSRHSTTYTILYGGECLEDEDYESLPEALRRLADLLE